MSRDLTFNDTISSLDDTDNLTSVKHLRELGSAAYAGQIDMIGNNRTGPAITTINHNTTVRDVVSSRIRNNKLKNNLHHHVTVNASDLTGPPSFIHTFINNSSDHRMPMVANCQSKYLHNSSSLSVNSFLAKSGVVSGVIGQQQKSSGSPIAIASANLPAGFGTAYYSSVKPAAAIQSNPQAQTTMFSNSATVFQTNNNNISIGVVPVQFHQQSVSVVQHQKPPQQQQIRPSAAQFYASDVSVGSVVKAAKNLSPAKSARCSSPYVSSAMALPSRSAEDSCESPSRSTPVAGSTTPTNSTQQQPSNNSHPSPRPSILRGSCAVRRLVDRDASSRPESASGLSCTEAEEIAAFASTSNHLSRHPSTNNLHGVQHQAPIRAGSSSGEDSNHPNFPLSGRIGGSPRKRPRKQQFDNSQQDKLMMQVRSDQSAALHSTIESIVRQQTAAVGDSGSKSLSSTLQPSTLKLATQFDKAGGKISSTKVARQRGRPRSTALRPDDLLSALPSLMVETPTSFVTMSNGLSTAQISPSTSSMAAYQTTGNEHSTAVNHAFMVDVDSMLGDVAVKKRKYKKRQPPELDPETGEPVKKPRKKGSGRKSKKDQQLLVDGVLANKFLGPGTLVSAIPSSSTSATHSVLVDYTSVAEMRTFDGKNSPILTAQNPPASAEEQFVISALCNFKSNQARRSTIATTTISCEPQVELNNVKMEPSPSLDSVASSADMFSVAEPKTKGGERRGSLSRVKRKLSQKDVHHPLRQNSTVPLVLDLKQFTALRPILRRCDHRRKDGDSLEDSYEELSNFLAASKTTKSTVPDTYGTIHVDSRQRGSSRDWGPRRDIACQVFESYDEFKTSCESIRLLPFACSYFHNSQKLLHELRTNLFGYSVYRTVKQHLEDLQQKPITSTEQLASISDLLASDVFPLESDGDDGKRTRRGVFSGLVDVFRRCKTYSRNNSDEDDLLLNLDVAGTLDNLMEGVERSFDKTFPGALSPSAEQFTSSSNGSIDDDQSGLKTSNCPSSSSISNDSIATKLIERLPECYQRILLPAGGYECPRKRMCRRRQKKKVFTDDKKTQGCEDGPTQSMSALSEGGIDSLVFQLQDLNSRLAKRCDTVRKMALQFLAQLDHVNFEAAVDDCGEDAGIRCAAETRFLMGVPRHRSSFKAKSIYNPGESILFCPTREAVDELFKNHGIPVINSDESIDDLDKNCHLVTQGCTEDANVQVNGELPKSPPLLTSLPKAKGRRKEKSPFFFVGNIDGMREDSAYIATLALARLRRRYPLEKLHSESEISSSLEKKSKLGTGKVDGKEGELKVEEEYFEPSLKYRFPPDTDPSGQEEFMKNRVRETQELYATVLRLMNSHANLGKQCLDSLASLMCPSQDSDHPEMSNSATECVDDQQPEDHQQQESEGESMGSSESEEDEIGSGAGKVMALKQQLKGHRRPGILSSLKNASRNTVKDKSGRFASLTIGVSKKRTATGS